jgi:hypothetical protein
MNMEFNRLRITELLEGLFVIPRMSGFDSFVNNLNPFRTGYLKLSCPSFSPNWLKNNYSF